MLVERDQQITEKMELLRVQQAQSIQQRQSLIADMEQANKEAMQAASHRYEAASSHRAALDHQITLKRAEESYEQAKMDEQQLTSRRQNAERELISQREIARLKVFIFPLIISSIYLSRL